MKDKVFAAIESYVFFSFSCTLPSGEPTEAALRVLGEKLGFTGRKAQSTDPHIIAREATDYFAAKYNKVN